MEKNRLLALIGEARLLLRDIKPCHNFYKLADPDPELVAERERKLVRINFLRADQALSDLQLLPTIVDYDLFFEVLTNNIKNDIISYQTYVFRTLAAERTSIVTQLLELRHDYSNNVAHICELEHVLQTYSEREIELALESHPIYEHINGEKMSPRFLKLI
jgi:hypothetical protein